MYDLIGLPQPFLPHFSSIPLHLANARPAEPFNPTVPRPYSTRSARRIARTRGTPRPCPSRPDPASHSWYNIHARCQVSGTGGIYRLKLVPAALHPPPRQGVVHSCVIRGVDHCRKYCTRNIFLYGILWNTSGILGMYSTIFPKSDPKWDNICQNDHIFWNFELYGIYITWSLAYEEYSEWSTPRKNV